MSRYIRKEITGGMIWTAPAGVTNIKLTIVDLNNDYINGGGYGGGNGGQVYIIRKNGVA
jgi:outer membrane protein assembly factor BamB